MSMFYTTFLSKSDFSFALFLVTFEPLEIQHSNIPLLKALKCSINAVGAQRCSCLFTFCHTPLKIALLLHKMASGPYSLSETVFAHVWFETSLVTSGKKESLSHFSASACSFNAKTLFPCSLFSTSVITNQTWTISSQMWESQWLRLNTNFFVNYMFCIHIVNRWFW